MLALAKAECLPQFRWHFEGQCDRVARLARDRGNRQRMELAHYLSLRKWFATISVTMLPSPATAGEGMGVRANLRQLSGTSATLRKSCATQCGLKYSNGSRQSSKRDC